MAGEGREDETSHLNQKKKKRIMMCCLSSSTSSSFRDGLIIGTTRTGTGRPLLCVGLFFPSSQFLMSDHAGRRPPLVTSTLADPLMIQHQILQSAGLWPRAQIWPALMFVHQKTADQSLGRVEGEVTEMGTRGALMIGIRAQISPCWVRPMQFAKISRLSRQSANLGSLC